MSATTSLPSQLTEAILHTDTSGARRRAAIYRVWPASERFGGLGSWRI